VVGSGPQVDFARSSRGPSGTELTDTTFWGYAQDGVEVTSFGARTAEIQGAASPAIPPADIRKIYNCTYTTWSQVPGLGIAVGGPDDGPIVPWGMNTASGTYATFRDYIRTTTGDAAFDPSTTGCDRKLTNGQFPFENDIKPLVNDPVALSTSATSVDNPKNWIWWGSFGVFSAFPYTSNFTRSGTQVIAGAVPVNGVLPATNNILANTYPIGRTLYHVTKKTNADCPKTGGVCDFTGNPGPALAAGGTDFNVAGATSGNAGAVREYTRWLCRVSAAQQGIDTYTGTNFFSGETAAINKAGFTVVPVGLRTAGSRCQVLS
jgi:PBP superfamily domain